MTIQKYIAYLYRCITFVFILFVSTACSHAQEKPFLEWPIMSEQFSHYYAPASSGVYEYYLKPEYQEKAVNFNAQEAGIPIKGHHFSDDHVSTDMRYVELGSFQSGSYLYKLIAYNRSDDADIVIFNIQLNSYNGGGQLIDALLLDSRFGFEEVQKFSEFIISNDIVEIDYYVTQVIEIINGGELGNAIETPIPRLEMKEKYLIDQGGVFKLIFQVQEQ